MFEGNDNTWWVTGGLTEYGISLDSSEEYHGTSGIFLGGRDLPKEMDSHNLVNVNSSDMVALGGQYPGSDEVFLYSRYVLYCKMTVSSLHTSCVFYICKLILK